MPNTPKMTWPYPAKDADPWYTAFEDFAGAMDASAYAAREDRQLILTGGGTLTLAVPNLSWSDPLVVLSPVTGFQVRVDASNIDIPDGSALIIDVPRAPTANVTVTAYVGTQVPSTDNAYIIAVRSGSVLYFRNGWVLVSGTGSSFGTMTQGIPLSVATTAGEVLITSGANTVTTIPLAGASVGDVLTVQGLGPPVIGFDTPTTLPPPNDKGDMFAATAGLSMGILSSAGKADGTLLRVKASEPLGLEYSNIDLVGVGNAANGTGVSGTGGATNGKGVVGQGTGSGTGVTGTGGATSGSIGVEGTGVGTGIGVKGTGGATNGVGVRGIGTGAGIGVEGFSGAGATGVGVYGESAASNGDGVSGIGTGTGSGVVGVSGDVDASAGILGSSSATNGLGVKGTGSGTGSGVYGISGGTDASVGVQGDSAATNGHGVKGIGTGTGRGVWGVGGTLGVEGSAGVAGGVGVKGTGNGSGTGVSGTGGTTNGSIGVTGTSSATNGHGVQGTGTGTGYGIAAYSQAGQYPILASGGGITAMGLPASFCNNYTELTATTYTSPNPSPIFVSTNTPVITTKGLDITEVHTGVLGSGTLKYGFLFSVAGIYKIEYTGAFYTNTSTVTVDFGLILNGAGSFETNTTRRHTYLTSPNQQQFAHTWIVNASAADQIYINVKSGSSFALTTTYTNALATRIG